VANSQPILILQPYNSSSRYCQNTFSNVTQNGTEKYLRAASTGTTARSGVNRIGGAQAVVGGEVYKIRLKGYTTGTNPAFLNIRTNNTDLDWMNVRLPNNDKTEIWVERTITIPAGHTSMEVNVQWNIVNATDLMFINELEIIKQQTKSPEYQYYYKDHLGNIRLVFTTIQEQEIANAGYETANLSAETSRFQRMENARRVNSSIFDRTNGANSGFSQRLTGGTNEKYGIARTIKVMPGDTVKMEVFAKYVDRNTANWTSGFQTLMNSIAAASPTGGVVVDGSSYSTSTSSFPFPGHHNFADRTSGTTPRAFLNYISFDDNWNPILLDNTQTNFVRLSSTPIERGQDVAHERMAATFVVKQPGYVYIYLSNDETTPLEVFFDDFTVTHAKGPVVQSQDYYPFGLAFNSYNKENSTTNYHMFSGKEEQGELGLANLDFHARMYMPDIGRWGVVDPHADQYEIVTPYNYAFSNPLLFVDPTGMDNIIYVLVAGDMKKEEAQDMVDAANEMLMSLNLCEIKVQLYNKEENGEFDIKNLDETDNYAIIGTNRKEIVKLANKIDPDFGGALAEWEKRTEPGSPERSEDGFNAKGIVIDHSREGSNYGYSASPPNPADGSALALIHGDGHSLDLRRADSEFGSNHLRTGVMQPGMYWINGSGGKAEQRGLFYDVKNYGVRSVLYDNNEIYIQAMKARHSSSAPVDNYCRNKEARNKK